MSNEIKLYLRPGLAPGATDLFYLSRADGSADGTCSLVTAASVFGALLASTFAAASHTHTASDVTDFTAAADARIAAAVGVTVQAHSANLATFAVIAPSANVQTLLSSANYAAFRTSLGIGAVGLLATVTEADQTLGDNTTNNVSTTKHGYAPKLPNDSAVFLDGTGNYSAPAGGGGESTIVAPQGRLTLTSSTPVMNADATAQGTVYYTPYVGAGLPLYSGSAWAMRAFSQMALALNATDNLSTNLYDVFAFDNTGTLMLGTGPAWTSATARGTGAGTTEIELKDGIWTNKNAITLRAAGSSLGSIAANRATYLGTVYCTANGQTGFAVRTVAATGGTAAMVGFSNAYNRRPVEAMVRDNASHSYGSTTWRMMANSAGNRISFVDGLKGDYISAMGSVVAPHTASTGSQAGVNLDSTTATPDPASQINGWLQTTGPIVTTATPVSFYPQLGFHYLQHMQAAEATASTIMNTWLRATIWQ
jgi:hypothetical protein